MEVVIDYTYYMMKMMIMMMMIMIMMMTMIIIVAQLIFKIGPPDFAWKSIWIILNI